MRLQLRVHATSHRRPREAWWHREGWPRIQPRQAWRDVAALAVVILASVLVRPAQADDGVHAAVTYFQEPAPNTALTVIHPQIQYSQDFRDKFGLSLGYDADIVTGATPQIFGVDAMSGATEFQDTRHNGSLGFRFITDHATLSLAGGFAGENDYMSGTVSAGVRTDLFNRNTQLSVDYTHNFDRVCDAANTDRQELLSLRALDSSDECFTNDDLVATRQLAIDSVQLGITQIITPWLLVQLGATGQLLNGFQANPYRQVLLGRRAVQEHLPDVRNRLAIFGRALFALKPIRGSIEMDVRGYWDSWAVEALTADVAWNQYLARALVLRVRGRWHIQDSALFYRDGNAYASGGPAGSYWTGDRELSALMNSLVGAKLTYLWRAQEKQLGNVIEAIEISAKSDLLFYRSLTEHPQWSPNYDRTQGLIDALVVSAQVGFEF